MDSLVLDNRPSISMDRIRSYTGCGCYAHGLARGQMTVRSAARNSDTAHRGIHVRISSKFINSGILSSCNVARTTGDTNTDALH